MAKNPQPTNIDSNLWAKAARVYAEDQGKIDRAKKVIAKIRGEQRAHQNEFEEQGISASAIRERFRESDMSSEEFQALISTEIVSRRALGLTVWNAESDADWDEIMTRASRTEPAEIEALEDLEGARAYNDGFNGGAHGGQSVDDNPNTPGTVMHAQWARGCKDGIDYKETFAVAAREAHAMGVPASGGNGAAPAKRPRGRPRKKPLEVLQENAEKFGADPAAPAGNDEAEGLFGGEPANDLPI